jgi:serine/threonine-protein kinase
MLRGWIRLAIGVFYVLALASVFAIAGYFAFNGYVRRGAMPVPDLVGLPLVEAEALLADQGLGLRHLEREDRFDDSVPAGMVLDHDPPAGSLVKRGARIEVVLSRGQQLVEMPELRGNTLQAAQVALASVGLSLGRRSDVYSQRDEPGSVVFQSPPAGELVERSSRVHLMVSIENRAEVYVMPDLVARSDIEVRDFFTRRGFRLGSVKYEPYEGVAEGTVLRQYPLAGHPLRRDEPIALVVAAPHEERG